MRPRRAPARKLELTRVWAIQTADSVLAVILTDMGCHIDQHVTDVRIGYLIENLARLSLTPHKPGTTQQPKMVAYESLGKPKAFRDVANRLGHIQAEQQYPQTGWIAEQTKGLGQNGHLMAR